MIEDLGVTSVWQRLRDLRLRRVEVFTMTRGEFDEWKCSPGTLAEIVASTGIVVHGDAEPAAPCAIATDLDDTPAVRGPRFRRRPGRGHHVSRRAGRADDR